MWSFGFWWRVAESSGNLERSRCLDAAVKPPGPFQGWGVHYHMTGTLGVEEVYPEHECAVAACEGVTEAGQRL
jgi:hypothetical protein